MIRRWTLGLAPSCASTSKRESRLAFGRCPVDTPNERRPAPYEPYIIDAPLNSLRDQAQYEIPRLAYKVEHIQSYDDGPGRGGDSHSGWSARYEERGFLFKSAS